MPSQSDPVSRSVANSCRRAACPDCLPANDNDDPSLIARRRAQSPSAETLAEALRYFAKHGLSAAGNAASEAIAARDEGEEDRYQYWLSICRTFDRRTARQIESSVARQG